MVTYPSTAHALLAVANHYNQQAVKFNEVSFEIPLSITDTLYDTAVTLQSTSTSRYIGPQTLYYNRWDLASIVTSLVLGQGDNETDWYTVLSHRFNMTITDDDVTFTRDDNAVTLTAMSSSLFFLGEVDVPLIEGTIEMTDVVTVSLLDGLYFYPAEAA